MGRFKIKVYQYSNIGKYLRSWESMAEIRNYYFSHISGKMPLFKTDDTTMVLPDGTILSKQKIGRVGVDEFLRKKDNPYLNSYKLQNNNKVLIYNLNNELIAEFNNHKICTNLLNISNNDLLRKLKRQSVGKDGLIFKYKQE